MQVLKFCVSIVEQQVGIFYPANFMALVSDIANREEPNVGLKGGNGADSDSNMTESALRVMKALPIGIDNFQSLILGKKDGEHCYYVDKTLLIRELASDTGQVHLIPRPRRFGKSLNLDMIRQFMSIEADKSLFHGLKISEDQAFCKEFQGQYPVLYFDMKDINGKTFAEACNEFSAQIVYIMSAYYESLKTSPHLTQEERNTCKLYADKGKWKDEDGKPTNSLSISDLKASLQNLSLYLRKHYNKKVVVLIDEYDVPLNFAWVHEKSDPGYYDNMVDLIRGTFSKLLKNNKSLAFGVVTGCLRIARESIFTGMNNLMVWGYDNQFKQEYFGFTDSEVRAMLDYYGIPDFYDTTKEWYDGFNFGGEDLYSPWDVLQYVQNCVEPRSSKKPQKFWANSSGNDILTELLQRSNPDIQKKYTNLMNGDTIEAEIMHEMTFRDLEDVDNLWSLMLATGYLTVVSEEENESAILRAPNLEVRKLLGKHLKWWIKSTTGLKADRISSFCAAFPKGDVERIKELLTKILTGMIHLQDQRQSEERRESLYQGIVLGLLYYNWMPKSNMESGDGYCDISFEATNQVGVVIEMKDPGKDDLEKAAKSALDQIKTKHYTQELLNQGCTKIFMYGIACRFHSVSVIMEIYNALPVSSQSPTL